MYAIVAMLEYQLKEIYAVVMHKNKLIKFHTARFFKNI